MRLSLALCLVAGCHAATESEAVIDRLAAQTLPGGRALLPAVADPSVAPSARMELPARASSPLRLADRRSPLSVEVTLLGAADVPAEAVRGYSVYRGALDGAHLVARPTPHGSEDYLEFARAPAEAVVRYAVTLSEEVAGLRQIENTLELLDAAGAPRLRLAEPLLLDGEGRVHRPRLVVSGCAVDSSGAPPWGRAVTAPGSRHCTVAIDWSGEAVHYPAVLDPTWSTTVGMMRSRTAHTATQLKSGAVLVVGGDDVDGRGVELYNAGGFTVMNSTSYPRSGHTATFLSNSRADPGRVLVVGGNLSVGNNESFSALTFTWSTTGVLSPPRAWHTASILGTRVVFAGGRDVNGNYLSNVDTYTISSGVWATSPALKDARGFHTASRTAAGQLLIAGGTGASGMLATTQLSSIDGSNAIQWAWAAPMASVRSNHSALSLADGSILVAGGYLSCPLRSTCTYSPGTERYANGVWSAVGNLPGGKRSNGALVSLNGNRAVFTGGRYVPGGGIFSLPDVVKVDLFDGSAWHATTSMHYGRSSHTGTLISDGQVLVTGGPGSTAEVLALDPNGAPCSNASDCLTGFCRDGVCCDSPCDGGCNACSTARGAAVNGTCAVLSAGLAGSCGAYLCQGASGCPSSCTVDGQCSAGNYCAAGACVPKQAVGAACTLAGQCSGGVCVDGFCCDAACTGSCTACSLARGSTQNGHCANVNGSGRASCAPYFCDGNSPDCPTACGAGLRFCTTLNRCVPNDYCCGAGECVTSPDSCHQSAGTCNDGACAYAPIDCGAGVCSAGACASGPLTLTVTPVSTTASWAPRMFVNGTVGYTATLTNVSSATLSVSPSALGNIGVTSFTKDGVAVDRRGTVYDFVSPDLFYRTLVPLAPGASVQIPIAAVSGTDLTPGMARVTDEFLAAGPGVYAARFFYQYTGGDQGRTDVFRGTVGAAAALVTVQ